MKRKPSPAQNRLAAFIELTKPRITFLILVSTALGFYMASSKDIDWIAFFYTMVGTLFLSGGAGTVNHYIEKDLDTLMNRTQSRPIPAGLIEHNIALYFGIVLSAIGILILFLLVNQLTALLGILTLILYIFIYTPLKKITWLNTTIGAIPGAMPVLGGWSGASNSISPDAWILFAILFLWQHPHFYAIALMCKDDYKKAGFMMLPVVEEDNIRTNRQIIWHAFLLIPVSLYFVITGTLGIFYFWGAIFLGLGYLLSSIPLLKESSIKNAKVLLKASVIYLPLLLIIILIDKNY
tara:strand:+ start:444 stop:1325 length:882 start_codon:yes stop_codon:yes gene_type:complete